MTHFTANCGCKWTLRTERTISPKDVLQGAFDHANSTGHTVDVHGMVEPSNPPKRAKTAKTKHRNYHLVDFNGDDDAIDRSDA